MIKLYNKNYWGSDMKDDANLTEDQTERIKSTLARIRAGLERKTGKSQFEEPAHIFSPEAYDAGEK